MIKFSIVTCAYNAAGTLQPTLQSVLNQTFQDVEHIIIDGASNDETVAMAKKYKAENDADACGHEVFITSEHDEGLYDAMNKGIDKASGTYILFLNSGDTFPNSQTLQDVSDSIADGEKLPGVIYGDTDIVDGAGHFLRHRRLSAPETLSWRSFRSGMSVCHQAFYALTDIAKNNHYDLNYKYSADVDWCIRVMKETERRGLALNNVHEVVVNYLEGGMSIVNHRASLNERFDIMRFHYGLFTTIIMHVWFAVRSIVK